MFAAIADWLAGMGVAEAAFGALGVAAVLIWPRFTNYRSVVAIQCLGAAAFAVHFALGSSPTASASCVIAIAQLVVSATIRIRAVVMLLYAGSLLLLISTAAATWEGLPTVLAASGSFLGAFARIQLSTFRMKVGFLVAAPLWIAHNILAGSVFALAVDAISVLSNGASVFGIVKRRLAMPRVLAEPPHSLTVCG